MLARECIALEAVKPVSLKPVGFVLQKRFTMWSAWGALPFRIKVGPQRAPSPPVTGSGPRYHIDSRDLRKIHKAAVTGNVEKLEQILYFGLKGPDKRDKRNR